MKKLAMGIVLVICAIQGVYAVNSVTRSKTIIQQILKYDASLPSNAQLSEIGLAFLYHPASRAILAQYLEQQALSLNPSDETVLQDVGTLSGDPPVFTPSSAPTVNQYLSTVHRRNLRKYHIDALRAYRLRTADAPALPIEEARASVIRTAETDAALIVGDNTDDPES